MMGWRVGLGWGEFRGRLTSQPMAILHGGDMLISVSLCV